MRIIIAGCGSLGSGLAQVLAREGNQVTVLSHDESQFKALGENFPGTTMTGIEFDKGLLETAGIARADGLISCTDSDETNALVARIARLYYKVPKVIARLSDQMKVNIYNALGIQVIASTRWGIDRAKELLTFSRLENVLTIGNTPVEIIRVEVTELWSGHSLSHSFPISGCKPIAISRGNQSFIPHSDTRLETHDIVYLAAMPEARAELNRMLDF